MDYKPLEPPENSMLLGLLLRIIKTTTSTTVKRVALSLYHLVSEMLE